MNNDFINWLIGAALALLLVLSVGAFNRAATIAESGSCVAEAQSPADRFHVRLERPTPCDVRTLLLEAREAIAAALKTTEGEQ